MPDRYALFLVPEAPYPARGGGALRSASLLEYLAGRYEVDVIVFREPGAADPTELFPRGIAREIHVLELPHHRKDAISRVVRNTGRLARGVPPLVDRFAGFADRIAALVRGRSYQVAVIEHFWCAPYWEQVATVSAKTVLDLHNIESVLHERCARTEQGPEALAHEIFCQSARELEAHWLPRYDCLLTASGADAQLARAIVPRSRIIVYPNTIPLVRRPQVPERDMVAFSGNLEYHPNVAAVRFFRNEIWPILRDRWPSLVWRLVGKNPQAVEKYTAGDARIEKSGAVEDAIEELAAAKVVVVPLLAGSGTRFKVIEGWAAGRAIVSTTIGAEGLPARHNENLLIADGAEDFAKEVSAVLTSPDLRARLGGAGRALFESEFTWDRAWQSLDL
ncbi:MAG: glycosyltransferase family 4 protein [Acidobacteriia bacterium]|nr:glycosyltransferase family 4 protein [Terriglobia bacterium]